ncbi:uncharacterized protein METZ01_LOCUS290232, partial [marine metagenome]
MTVKKGIFMMKVLRKFLVTDVDNT